MDTPSRKRAKQPLKRVQDELKRVRRDLGALLHREGNTGPSTSSHACAGDGNPTSNNTSSFGSPMERSPRPASPMDEDITRMMGTSPSERDNGPNGTGTCHEVPPGGVTSRSQDPENTVTKVSSRLTGSNPPTWIEQPELKQAPQEGPAVGSPEENFESSAAGLPGSIVGAAQIGSLQEVSDMLQRFDNMSMTQGAVKTEYEALQQRLHVLLKALASHSDAGVSPVITLKIQTIRDFVDGQLNIIGGHRAELQPGQFVLAKEGEESLLACYRQVQAHMDRLWLDTALSLWKMEEKQSNDHISFLIDRLPSSPLACYDSSAGQELKRRGCTPGTRIDVLTNLHMWARGGGGGLYWINGMAGTGKTTIAYTMCKELDDKLKLGASFFCSRLRDECRNVNMIIPSIAHQLAYFSPAFLSALSTVLEKEPDVHTKRLDLQFKSLLEDPLISAKAMLPQGIVVVIDALDECENKEGTRDMLSVLLSRAVDIPAKFIISSRPEPQIRDQMTDVQLRSKLVLHELDTGEVKLDIERYLRVGLARIDPSEAQISTLAEKAGILFIYAATVVRYIGYSNFRYSQSRFQTILRGSRTQRIANDKEIDQLYTTILEESLGDGEIEDDEREEMLQVLHTVICAREPLTTTSISELLRVDVNNVWASLEPLRSVLHVVESKQLITTLHASFPDFMFDPARSNAYHCDSEAHNHKLAKHCFNRIAQAQPQFNICGLESSYLADKEVPGIEDRIGRAIPPELLYACRYWADHVKAGNCVSNVVERMREFLSERLLLWLEVLNLNEQMRAGVECMRLTSKWCNELSGNWELAELAQDARRFVDKFTSNPISQSTPHIYVSMMAFWPRDSPVAKHYVKFIEGPVEAEGTALDRQQLEHLSTWRFDTRIHAMAISPDGLSIALGLGEKVELVDSSSGRDLLRSLKGHKRRIRSIVFSPDGTRVFASSFYLMGTCYIGDPDRHLDTPSDADADSVNDATVLGWDPRSGDTVLGPLQLHGHTEGINCLSFSPDCTLIVTGSNDATVRLWEAKTGQILHCLQAQGSVNTVVFSPDGVKVATGSEGTLQVWDTRTGNVVHRPVTHTEGFGRQPLAFTPDGLRIISVSSDQCHIYAWDAQTGEKILGPIRGHTDYIHCIGCSPDGKYFISGSEISDQTVRVWDIQTGSIVLGPLRAHPSSITSVAFTPDGSRIISACDSGLVCTWDAQLRSLPPSSTDTPFDPITCVKFSSDGTRFVSGSKEGTISIWDALTGHMTVGPIKAHSSYIYAVDFVNDRVVSGTDDGWICVCDALTGEVVLGPLQLGARMIESIRCSPNGQMIAAVSDKRVGVWNGQNGNQVLGPLTGLDGEVVCVRFSPDSTRIVAGSFAGRSNLAVWDVSTGETLFGTLDGHFGRVDSVSYSSNGALIASGSWDSTIIVWDAYTGEKRLGPLTAHSHWIFSVHFSPDNTHLVSGARDGTIRIWDVETGEMVFELLSGHQDGITSVEYSPEGTHIMSCSYDRSGRIHDARTPAERSLSCLESELGDWTINKDGWVVDDQSRLLVWVPGDLRKALMRSRTQVIVAHYGYVRLKFDKFRIGESWAECYTSGM